MFLIFQINCLYLWRLAEFSDKFRILLICVHFTKLNSLSMKRIFKPTSPLMLLYLITVLSVMVSPFTAGAKQINLAGVYEANDKKDGLRRQMYMTLDFLNDRTPDFTQVFTTKESQFKYLPKDFMNAKKLKRNFAGTFAPGFARYREHFLFANTEEIRFSNPEAEDGLIKADWVSTDGHKGICYFIVNPDRTVQILGLTALPRELSPDYLVLNLVEDRLPAGAEPFVTPPAIAEFTINEYQKNFKTPTVISIADDVDMQVIQAVQKDGEVTINMRARNMTPYDNFMMFPGPHADGYAIAENGTRYEGVCGAFGKKRTDKESIQIPMPKGKWVEFQLIIPKVNKPVDMFATVFVECQTSVIIPKNHCIQIQNLPVFQDLPADMKRLVNPATNTTKPTGDTPKTNDGNNQPSTPPAGDPSGNSQPKSDPKDSFPVLWREDGPVQYELHMSDIGGDYGRFHTDASLDFWEDNTVKGEPIAARWIYSCVYDNGRMYEGEYIYYGHREGNKIVFTRRFDVGQYGYHSEPVLENLDPHEVLTVAPNGKDLIFDRCTYKRTY